MTVLLALVCCAPVAYAETLTVNDGVSSSCYVPINSPDYNVVDTRSQMIYPATELTAMVGQPINGITFYINNDGNQMNGGVLRLSIGETSKTVYTSATAYIYGLTPVANVSMNRGETSIVIDFDAPYVYNGGNLVIDCCVLEAGEFGWTYFLGEMQSTSTAISRDDLRQFLPKATFDYGEAPEYGAKVKYSELTFNTIRVGERDELTVSLKNIGLNEFNPVATVAAPFSAELPAMALEPGNTVEFPVAFEPTEIGAFQGTLYIDCGQAGVLEVTLNGTALAGGEEMTVCDGSATNQYVPFNGIYADDENTVGQMIYPADVLQSMKDGKIVSMSFYTSSSINLRNASLEISLMNTDQDEFDQATPLTGLVNVGSTDVVRGENVITFEFDQPFEYTGGNLAVQVKVVKKNTSVTTATTFFKGEATDYYASLSCFQSWSGAKKERQQFLPKASFVYQQSSTDFVLGDLNEDGHVDVTDVTLLIKAVLSSDTTGINVQAANCSGDPEGVLDVTDVTTLISMILNV